MDLTFDEIANKGIFNNISYEIAVAKSIKEVLVDNQHPAARILYEREIKILERYRDKICEWDFAKAKIATELLNEEIKQLIYERG